METKLAGKGVYLVLIRVKVVYYAVIHLMQKHINSEADANSSLLLYSRKTA